MNRIVNLRNIFLVKAKYLMLFACFSLVLSSCSNEPTTTSKKNDGNDVPSKNVDRNSEFCYKYSVGYQVEKDHNKAAQYCLKAAQAGDSNAQAQLGGMYDFGMGVTQNYKLAAEWYRKAADQNHSKAQSALGHLYMDGNGVVQDKKVAFELFKNAAEQDDDEAQNALAGAYYFGNGVDKNINLAVEWYIKSAQKGCAPAQYNLAKFYESGEGVAKDNSQTLYWLRKASNQGLATAISDLGTKYLKGEGVPKNRVVAYALYSVSFQSVGSRDYMKQNQLTAAKKMSENDIVLGDNLKAQMLNKNNLLDALDSYINSVGKTN